MVEAAGKAWRGDRPARFVQAAAEYLPFEGGEFDLVTSTVSFHHWQDQQAGLNEIERMLRSTGLTPGGFGTVFTVFGAPVISSVWAKGQRHECAKPTTAR
jgi:ubiquinone/menaquinone biosynthesis C-methylase UbiE